MKGHIVEAQVGQRVKIRPARPAEPLGILVAEVFPDFKDPQQPIAVGFGCRIPALAEMPSCQIPRHEPPTTQDQDQQLQHHQQQTDHQPHARFCHKTSLFVFYFSISPHGFQASWVVWAGGVES